MTETNLSMKQKQTHGPGEQTCGCLGNPLAFGEGMEGEVGVSDVSKLLCIYMCVCVCIYIYIYIMGKQSPTV